MCTRSVHREHFRAAIQAQVQLPWPRRAPEADRRRCQGSSRSRSRDRRSRRLRASAIALTSDASVRRSGTAVPSQSNTIASKRLSSSIRRGSRPRSTRHLSMRSGRGGVIRIECPDRARPRPRRRSRLTRRWLSAPGQMVPPRPVGRSCPRGRCDYASTVLRSNAEVRVVVPEPHVPMDPMSCPVPAGHRPATSAALSSLSNHRGSVATASPRGRRIVRGPRSDLTSSGRDQELAVGPEHEVRELSGVEAVAPTTSGSTPPHRALERR